MGATLEMELTGSFRTLRIKLLLLLLLLIVFMGGVNPQQVKNSPQVLNDGSFKFGFGKTSFSCAGRAAGYYADVETGCQIYHMCDGLGRQFSYECPNTTLFQQRMLICDHWYMVNCSKAESNYAANLLIGQRDKPFVTEDENQLRTPRPDLLDRPFSNFPAETFKFNFINKATNQAPQNAIVPSRGKQSTKAPHSSSKGSKPSGNQPAEIFEESASNHGLPIHWGTRYAKEDGEEEEAKEQQLDGPGSTVIPLNAEEQELQNNKINGRRDVKDDESKDESRNTVRFASRENTTVASGQRGVKVPSIRYEPPFTPEEEVRRQNSSREALAPGFKPFESILKFNQKGNRKDYDFSNFFGRNESIRNTVPTTTSTIATSTTPRAIASSTSRFQSSSQSVTARPTTRFSTTTTTRQPSTITSPSTTARPLTIVVRDPQPSQASPTQFASRTGSAFRPVLTTTTTTARPVFSSSSTAKPRELSDPRQSNRAPTTILFNPPAATAGLFETSFAFQRPAVSPANVPVPSREILPPFENVANFDKIKTQFVNQAIFTRQPTINDPSAGPVTSVIEKLTEDVKPVIQNREDNIPRPFSVPTPANDLLPPKKDYVYYDDSTTKGPPIYYQWKWSIPSFGLEPPLDAPPAPEEDKLSSQINPNSFEHSPDASREHNQTARSISSETGNLGENIPSTASTKTQQHKRKIQLPEHNYLELRQKLSIPDFTFPLESEPNTANTRGTYEHDGAVNSFQIRIPAHARSDNKNSTAWYGENAKCPECHPAFLRNNSCEPCIKIRR
ncbi:location of vulva defective 1 [Uranotaenia lowii]|uniref:location of vulva defective 1 n=1 Tax=Uranotaenia lowii TaxID=190385 RepID=UPI00247AB152|nr:location of vulva defective 1 [Uranotaenia lowii]XP_055609173.1 location of vulva defective 1 [Uranotaenia lowii]